MGRRFLLSIGAAALLAACAAEGGRPPVAGLASDPSMGPPKEGVGGYLTAADVVGAQVLAPPPAPSSPQGRADRAAFDESRALEGSARWKTAIQDNDLWTGEGAVSRFACALGKTIDAQATPRTLTLLQRLEADVRTIGSPAKAHFNRDRPLIGNDKPICVPREDWMRTNKSYPSGHAMTVWAWALTLSEAAPARGNALLALGRESGDSRVVCGVHFPSDIEAGRTLAAAMVARLHAEPAFVADVAAAKREIARAPTKSCPG